jgi:rod shape-determining protein MreC
VLPIRKKPLWKGLNFWIFIILLVFSIFSFTSKGAVKTGIVRNISAVLLFPIEKTISFVSNLFTLHRQNTELRKEIAEVSLQMQRCANIRKENAKLREWYGFQAMSDFMLVPCEIIGKSPGLYNKSIILDRGEKAAVRKNLPVIAAHGLVGKILETSILTSEMLTLYNRNALVSAIDLRSRVQGIVKWKGSQYLMLDDVPLHSDILVGDTIITSGMGGIYPKGIFVGVVQSVGESPKEIVMTIKVKPFVDISLLEDVFIIKEVKRTGSILESDSPMESREYFDIFKTVKDPKTFGDSAFGSEGKKGKRMYGTGLKIPSIE